MQVLVSLKFGDGDFTNGFPEISIFTSKVDSQHFQEIQIQLPPAPEIPKSYQNWQNKYINLFETLGIRILTPISVATSFGLEHDNFVRGFNKNILTNFSVEKQKQEFEESKKECDRYASDLRTEVNQWLEKVKSKLEARLQLDPNSQVLLEIHTQNITSQQTKDILHRLPWREWDYFQKGSNLEGETKGKVEVEVEAVLCLRESNSPAPEVKDDGIFRRVRITSIFGDSQNISVEKDKELIAKLEKRGAELINLEQPQRQDFSKLWDEPCDILFYSGHSETSDDGTVGSLQINSQESLSLQEIRNTLGEAVKKGLKLAIFNSCDGLGLAKQLADLHLPYIIVWREPVPDPTAIRFIKHFLSSYESGEPLFTSVRNARLKLVELTSQKEREKQILELSWLPIICKNTSDPPPTWKDLGGLTGKLPHSPYKGLSAFQEEDAEYFFGREKFIADLVEAANSKPLVPVVGASGSGKSSVVFAGLVPRLREYGMQIVSFRPGKNPFDALAIALSSHIRSTVIGTQESNPIRTKGNNSNTTVIATKVNNLNSPVIATKGSNPNPLETSNECAIPTKINLLDNEKTLCRLIENIVASNEKTSSPRFILIADQFEELYTLTSETQQQPFLNLLLHAVKFAPNFSLVLTLRADFYGHAISNRDFSDLLQQGVYNSSPMNQEELCAAIEQPAAKMKVELEQGLTTRFIDDLGDRPGRLPLLEFTLLQLWEKHDKWYLTHKVYEQIGGLDKALAEYADSILKSLFAADKEKAERIFIQLVSPGEGTEDTKRKAARSEVGKNNWDLVEFLVNKRLLITGWDQTNQEKTVEIIHEALIREWGMLRRWIKSNRQFRVWQERLQFTVVKWEDKQRDSEYLLSGGNLGEAEGWYFDQKYREYLSDTQSEFIRESLDAKDREEAEKERQRQEKVRLQKRAISWLGGGLLAVSAATGFTAWNWVNAEIKSTREQLNSSILTSENYLNSDNYSDALFEAIKTQQFLDDSWWKSQVPSEIQKKIQIVINQQTHSFIEAKHTIKGHKNGVLSVVFSPDGKTIASASTDGKLKLWDAQNGQLIHTFEGHENEVWSVVFSPDGKIIASASVDGTIKFWDAHNHKSINTLEGHKSSVWSVVFSPDGKTIASASVDGTLSLWNAQNRKLIHAFGGHKNEVRSVVFSPDGKTIASASVDGTIKLWNWNFDNLLTRGCNKLKDYLVNSPEKLQELKVCQNQEILTAAASTLVEQGEESAKDGDLKEAVEKFRQAKKWNPKLDFNPESKAKAISLNEGVRSKK